MHSKDQRLRRFPSARGARFAILLAGLALTACGGADNAAAGNISQSPKPPTPVAGTASLDESLLLSPEDVLIVRSKTLASGPSVTGSVQPARHADLRAEVAAVIMQVLKENGDTVRRGDVLVRLDDTAIRESLISADASAR